MKLGKNTLIIRPKLQWKKIKKIHGMKCTNVGQVILRKKSEPIKK